jgi:hypothetical protein
MDQFQNLFVVRSGSEDVDLLLAAGADANAVLPEGETVLMTAARVDGRRWCGRHIEPTITVPDMTRSSSMRGLKILTGKALAITFALGLSWSVPAQAQKATGRGGALLSAEDRAGIQELVAHYARALATCSSKEYAELFTPDGVFFSDDFRGKTHRELYGKSAKLVGRTKIAELVETEEFCKDPAIRAERIKSGGGNAARPPAAPVLEATADGVRGTIPIGKGGRYEDVYVKTQDGWRFKSRSVFMPPVAGAPPASSPAR